MIVSIERGLPKTLVYDQLKVGEVYLIDGSHYGKIPVMLTNTAVLVNLNTGGVVKNALGRDYHQCSAELKVTTN